MLPRLVTAMAAGALLLAAPASAIVKLPASLSSVAGNPAERLVKLPIEQSSYDAASRCTPKASRPGMVAFQKWLEGNARGVSWGTYRCEKWGKNSASLHAEGRAIDWHLDVSNAADKRAAKALILLLLAPDSAGNQQALARRMGVEEIIWDCGYWGAGMSAFKPYGYCYSKRGKLKKSIDATAAHRNHIHFGLTRAGAAKKTSFWTRKGARNPAPLDTNDHGWGDDDDSGFDDEPPADEDELDSSGGAYDDSTGDPYDGAGGEQYDDEDGV